MNDSDRPLERPPASATGPSVATELPEHAARILSIRAGHAFRGSREQAARDLIDVALEAVCLVDLAARDELLDELVDHVTRIQRARRRGLRLALEEREAA